MLDISDTQLQTNPHEYAALELIEEVDPRRYVRLSPDVFC